MPNRTAPMRSARSLVAVSTWRLRRLLNEETNCRATPPPSAGPTPPPAPVTDRTT